MAGRPPGLSRGAGELKLPRGKVPSLSPSFPQMRRIFFLLLLSLSSLCAAERKPNIVLVFIDDMGAVDVGCFGSKFRTS